MHTGF